MLDNAVKQLFDAGVTGIDYMHCDHFEPWADVVDLSRAEDNLHRFAELSESTWFSRRMTLFYLPGLEFCQVDKDGSDDVVSLSGESIGIQKRTELRKHIAASPMRRLVEMGHEMQLHVHHEHFTCSDEQGDPAIRSWIDQHSSPEADAARFEMLVRETLKAVREDTGQDLPNWHFVHGKWALNASDHRICRIGNEIEILMRNGCVADFTFPAGRKQTDPTFLETPFTCKPVSAGKAYDLPESDPLALAQTGARDAGRFMIWNSILKHPSASLDFHSPVARANFLEPEKAVLTWLRQSPILNGKLYLKTHAHSMSTRYWHDLAVPITPHSWPAVQMAFGLLKDACERGKLEFALKSTGEVYSELMLADTLSETPSLEESDPGGTVAGVPMADTESMAFRASEESQMKRQMEKLWRENLTPECRPAALQIARELYQSYGTRSAAYRLGLGAYTGKGTKRDHKEAYRYFLDEGLAGNKTVAFYRANILLDDECTLTDDALALKLLKEAEGAGIDGAAERLTEVQMRARGQSTNPENSVVGSELTEPELLNVSSAKGKVELDTLDSVARRSLSERVARLGETESGAYNFYMRRIQAGRLISDIEIRLRDRILDVLGDVAQIHDIGAGIGTMAMGFAGCGVRAIAIERDRRRYDAMRAMQDAIAVEFPELAQRLDCIQSPFPSEEIENRREQATVAVMTNFIATIPEETQLEIMSALARYDCVIVDLQRFCKSRSTHSEYQELIGSFLGAGFRHVEPLLELGKNGQFHRFCP